jgi:hypothetical protein
MRRPVPTVAPAPPGSLAAALGEVPDPRRPFGWRGAYPPIPLVALLQVAVAAMVCGCTGVTAIAQWVRERADDSPDLLLALGVPPGRTPCAATFHRIFKAIDVDIFEAVVGRWLQRTGVAPTDAVAVDGKTLRGVERAQAPGLHLVAAYAHDAQTVIAQLRTEGKGHELAAAKQLLSQIPLTGRLVTGDALLTQREVCRQIVAAGGDYLLPVEENQPRLRADIEAALSPLDADRP